MSTSSLSTRPSSRSIARAAPRKCSATSSSRPVLSSRAAAPISAWQRDTARRCRSRVISAGSAPIHPAKAPPQRAEQPSTPSPVAAEIAIAPTGADGGSGLTSTLFHTHNGSELIGGSAGAPPSCACSQITRSAARDRARLRSMPIRSIGSAVPGRSPAVSVTTTASR